MLARKLLVPVAILALALSACQGAAPPAAAGDNAATPTPRETLKARPQVVSITTTTVGNQADYYVILDASLKNDGAEGVVNVIASMAQAGNSTSKESVITLAKGGTQNVRFVFPLKWKGGDWQPKVTAEVP